jgi:hypothetical protein
MPLTLTTWKAVVDKKYFESDTFKRLDRSVRNYLVKPGDKTALDDLRDAWDAWNDSLGKKKGHKTYKTSDRYTPGCALDDIAAILQPPPVPISTVPMTLAEQVRQRDLLSDERSGEFVKVGGKWQQKIFTQQEANSCTCACATTFLSKLIGTSLKEDVFKKEYEKQIGAHDFTKSGAFLDDITKVLAACGADVVHKTTADLTTLLAELQKGTKHIPLVFGVSWKGGGAHAVMAEGQGQVQASHWATSSLCFIVEDPAAEHEEVLMYTDGSYYARVKGTGHWSEGSANPVYGCIIGKPSSGREVRSDYRTVGVKVL